VGAHLVGDTMTVTFTVHGTPAPQGSMKAFAVNGRAMIKPSGGNNFAAWRNAVAQAAHELVAEHGQLDGPLRLDVAFRFPMPASRPKATRARGWAWKTAAPDLDKLVRAVGDALSASGLIRDDALIVDLCATKIEVVGWTGATITLQPAAEMELEPWG